MKSSATATGSTAEAATRRHQGGVLAALALGLLGLALLGAPAPDARPAAPLEPTEATPTAVEPRAATGPLRLRVGLATDLRTVTLPCCDPKTRVALGMVEDGAASLPLDAEIRVEPAPGVTARSVFRLQVAALKDERQAAGMATYLAQTAGQPADAVFDAGIDLYRVRVGRFSTRPDAEAFRGRLAALGVGEGWIVSEGESPENPALRVLYRGRAFELGGRWLEVVAAPGGGVPFAGERYRGRLAVYLNDRGLLNVVNELALEDYLRGVVPKEMGPELYDEPEALKAQTVAARTFAVRNLGGFAQEGYDLCSTPRCQVYGGMAVEHPRSDRAIADTAGQVALAFGEPAETFYGATCGGHTENVEVVFPAKSGAYLRGVPCLEAGAAELSGDLRSGQGFPSALVRRLLPSPGGPSARALGARLEHLAIAAGLPVPRDRLRALERREVRRYVASVLDLALDRRLLASSPAELAALVVEPPGEWGERELRLAAWLDASGFAGAARGSVSGAEVEDLLFELALYLGVLRAESTRFLALEKAALSVRQGAESRRHELPGELATFRLRGGRLVSSPLALMAGDRLDFYWFRDRLAALVQPVEPTRVSLAHLAARQRWSRYMSVAQLRSKVQARYPGFPFADFEVLSRGVSGRIGKLRLKGSDGRTLDVEGLAVRWTFDLNDTLFYAEPAAGGWNFRGRGWGHGVGMCQAGAFGMAQRGSDYRAILEHYYTGIELGRLKPAPPRPRLVAGR